MIAVLGSGAFGAALATTLSRNGPVVLWGRSQQGRMIRQLPGLVLPDAVTVTDDLARTDGPDTVLLALPMQVLAGFVAEQAARLSGRRLVACCKGVDLHSGLGPVEILAALPGPSPAVLTGPSFAADIARGLPTALTLACADEGAEALQHALSTPVLRLYRTTDVLGAELGGALKNVIAIGAGVVMGAGLGDSARAALMTRGYAEMQRFALTRGARAETLAGLSGFGDLVLTATSDLSRNFLYGRALGAGEEFDAAITVEGASTAQAARVIARDRGIAMPIADAVAALAQGRASVADTVVELLQRPLKEE